MQQINEVETAIAKNETPDDRGYTFLMAYIHTQTLQNELLNIEKFYDENHSKLIASLNRYAIKEFTVSDHSTELLHALDVFTRCGWHIKGMTQVTISNRDIKTGRPLKAPAIVLER